MPPVRGQTGRTFFATIRGSLAPRPGSLHIAQRRSRPVGRSRVPDIQVDWFPPARPCGRLLTHWLSLFRLPVAASLLLASSRSLVLPQGE